MVDNKAIFGASKIFSNTLHNIFFHQFKDVIPSSFSIVSVEKTAISLTVVSLKVNVFFPIFKICLYLSQLSSGWL